jgi:UDP-N-acetyl-D-glucosamine dehydrogenase
MAEDGFAAAVTSRDVVIGIVGLGYVGLPLAVSYAESGFRTVGFDVDAERVAGLNRGQSHIGDMSDDRVRAAVDAGQFSATVAGSDLASVDAIFICVSTPFDATKTPDLSYIRDATHLVASLLRPGMLVILQSTTYPGTTVEIVQPVLEERGLRAGVDFHLAFSPERVDPGNTRWTFRNTPKVVGGVTGVCASRAQVLLEAVMEHPGLVRVVSTPAAAEMTKLLENTYRAVNIALVNELAMLAHEMEIDIWEVIDAAGTKPFGFQAFCPGIGPGGHCIPVDPYYLSWKAREFDFRTKFIDVAADTNLGMAKYVVHRIYEFMNQLGHTLHGARVLCLGASFKPGVSDVRNSRAIRVMELLDGAGAHVEYTDPRVPEVSLPSGKRKSLTADAVADESFDLAVVLVSSPDWRIGPLTAAGIPLFDAVNAAGLAGDAPNHERL